MNSLVAQKLYTIVFNLIIRNGTL